MVCSVSRLLLFCLGLLLVFVRKFVKKLFSNAPALVRYRKTKGGKMPSAAELQKIANLLRVYSIKMTTGAGSGHPTTCMSIAEIMACLFFSEMQYDIKEPFGYNNDEFVLSKGHAAPILWAAYAEAGIIEKNELMNLRKIDCDLEGHPTPRMPWVKAATGSLGQGLSVGVGLALAQRLDKSGRRVYVILGDGECAEGNVWEAANTAAYSNLSNLCAIIDVNRQGQSRETMHGHNIDAYVKKFAAFGWNTVAIDGHSVSEILEALKKFNACSDKPTAIIAKTFKGKGVSFLEDKDNCHGKPVTKDKLDAALEEIGDVSGIDAKPFVKKAEDKNPPELKYSFDIAEIEYKKGVATRMAYGDALVALGKVNERIVALDADVQNSTNEEPFFKEFPERSFESFIAEQNVIGMAIGLSARGFVPFMASFATFWTRAHDQIRMAAYSNANIKIVGSHVGVSIGEDGPSQMGLEDLAIFRPIPNCLIFYPSDGYSTVACTKIMAEHKGISFLRTSRPATPIVYDKNEAFEIGGSKVVKESAGDKVTVIGAGITLHNALKAHEELKKEGINVRVIDAYCVKPLDTAGIKKAVDSTAGRVVVVEDHFEEGGLGDAVKSALVSESLNMVHLCVRDLPRSGSPDALMEKYGIDANAIAKAVRSLL